MPPYTVSPLSLSTIPAQLDAAILHIDHWFAQNAHHFDPYNWRKSSEAQFKRKAFAEFGLYLHLVHLSGDSEILTEAAKQVIETVGAPRFRELILRKPQRFTLYTLPVILAKSYGLLSDDLLSAVKRVAAAPEVWSIERLPHRALDLWHACTCLGVPSRIAPESAMNLSCLRNPPLAHACSTDDGYALTHNIFYVTNFGMPHPEFPDHVTLPTPEMIAPLILRFIGEGNIDLALELVICALVSNTPETEVIIVALAVALRQLGSEGLLESPVGSDLEEILEQTPDLPDCFKSYHTMAVAGLAFRLARTRLLPRLTAEDFNFALSPGAGYREFGICLAELERYNLPVAAAYLDALIGRRVASALPVSFSRAINFIREQERPDGHYGLFVDEEQLYRQDGGQEHSFETAVRYPVTEVCRDLLARC